MKSNLKKTSIFIFLNFILKVYIIIIYELLNIIHYFKLIKLIDYKSYYTVFFLNDFLI